MKKVFLVVISMLILMILCASPVSATDPPDTEVDVTVVTPGDVDLDVGINAGGDVDVTVDGVDFKGTASLAQAAYNQATYNPPTNHMWDYTYYWYRTGLGERIEGQIAELQQISGILLDANAKLIIATGQSAEGQEGLATRLTALSSETNESLSQLKADAELLRADAQSMKARDDEIWSQLMYGAEAHIAILDAQLTVQESKVSGLQAELTSVKAQLEVADANNYALRNYVDYLQRQYMYYFWIIGGVLGLLSILLIITLRRKSL